MTSEAKYFIEVSDMIALRFECRRCQATVVLSLGAVQVNVNKLRVCPNCDASWLQIPDGATIESRVKKFADELKGFQNALETWFSHLGDETGFRFSVEIKPDVITALKP